MYYCCGTSPSSANTSPTDFPLQTSAGAANGPADSPKAQLCVQQFGRCEEGDNLMT
jgi:hypothetical protein